MTCDKTLTRMICAGVSLLVAPAMAAADTRSSTTATTLEEAMAGQPEEGALRLAVPWTGAAGTGVGFAYEGGNWGGHWMQGLRLRVPIGEHLGLHLRGMVVADLESDRWDVGGRLDAIGQSPVILNVMRLYGGGGVQLFRPVAGASQKKTQVGFGGHFGFEFFMSEWMSWILEVGGNSGGFEQFGGGATIVAGIQFHPWS